MSLDQPPPRSPVLRSSLQVGTAFCKRKAEEVEAVCDVKGTCVGAARWGVCDAQAAWREGGAEEGGGLCTFWGLDHFNVFA